MDKILHFTNTLIIINYIIPVTAGPHGGPMTVSQQQIKDLKQQLLSSMLHSMTKHVPGWIPVSARGQ